MTRLMTVGHGNASQEVFTELLREAGVARIVDVRRFPGSRRHPHFGSEVMAQWLTEAGIDYTWEQRLGGRRRVGPEERDADPWWRVEAFRAYAAYARSPDFTHALAELLESLGDDGDTAVMCSESLWWRCHRRLVSDVTVLVHGVEVLHLAHSGKLTEHPPAAGARLTDEGLRYDLVDEG